MTTIIILSNLTTLVVNLYTLWSVRKVLIAAAKKAEEDIKKI
jgi:hypothetical protein